MIILVSILLPYSKSVLFYVIDNLVIDNDDKIRRLIHECENCDKKINKLKNYLMKNIKNYE